MRVGARGPERTVNSQTDSVQGRLPGSEPRGSLDELGDLFFSTPGQPAADRAEPRLDDLICEHHPAKGAGAQTGAPAVQAVAILAGGLPPERRAALSRAAIRRLVPCDAHAPPPPVVLLSGNRAAVLTMAGQKIEPSALCDVAADAGRLVLVIADRAAAHLDAGRRLPDHCAVLVTPDAESLVEAYRELKTATGATTGPVPEVFVLEAGTETVAERTYRRLARVAIAHLNCTPTFAGHQLEQIGTPDDPSAAVPDEDADRVCRIMSSLFAPTDTKAPVSTRRDTVPQTHQPLTVEVRECPPTEGRPATAPPIAGVVSQPAVRPRQPAFTTWEPLGADELLGAARASIDGLLPGARGFVQLDGLVDAAEQPDALAVDHAGRAVALIVADGQQADALRRAIDAHAWLNAYAGLLARAFPQAGLDPTAQGSQSIVLVPEESAGALESLCPAHVGLAAYTPVACGEMRGLLFRHVLRSVGAAPSGPEARTADTPVPTVVTPRSVAVADTETPETTADQMDPAGTSPDDDLSADEINDLCGAFEIDELT